MTTRDMIYNATDATSIPYTERYTSKLLEKKTYEDLQSREVLARVEESDEV